MLCCGRGATPLSIPPSPPPFPALFPIRIMKPVPSWEQLGLGNVSPARQCSPCATQGHQLPSCLHVAGIKQLWLLPSVVPMGQDTLALNWLTLCMQKDPASSVAAWLAASPAATVYAADMLGFPRLSWQLPRHGSCGRVTLSLKALAPGHRVGTQGTRCPCSLFLTSRGFYLFSYNRK